MFEITVSTFLRYLKENLLNVKKHQSIRKEKKRKENRQRTKKITPTFKE